jgi:hypothetical protein
MDVGSDQPPLPYFGAGLALIAVLGIWLLVKEERWEVINCKFKLEPRAKSPNQ